MSTPTFPVAVRSLLCSSAREWGRGDRPPSRVANPRLPQKGAHPPVSLCIARPPFPSLASRLSGHRQRRDDLPGAEQGPRLEPLAV